jgi:hypothetical protein
MCHGCVDCATVGVGLGTLCRESLCTTAIDSFQAIVRSSFYFCLQCKAHARSEIRIDSISLWCALEADSAVHSFCMSSPSLAPALATSPSPSLSLLSPTSKSRRGSLGGGTDAMLKHSIAAAEVAASRKKGLPSGASSAGATANSSASTISHTTSPPITPAPTLSMPYTAALSNAIGPAPPSSAKARRLAKEAEENAKREAAENATNVQSYNEMLKKRQ